MRSPIISKAFSLPFASSKEAMKFIAEKKTKFMLNHTINLKSKTQDNQDETY